MRKGHQGEFTLGSFVNLFNYVTLGPGRPSAAGPRMDRRAVTSSGVVKISRLTSQAGRASYGGEISNEGSNPGKDVTKSIDY